MTTPVWLDASKQRTHRERSLYDAVVAYLGQSPSLSTDDGVRLRTAFGTVIRYVLGRRTSFSIADRQALVETAAALVLPDRLDAFYAAAMLADPFGVHSKKGGMAAAAVFREWTRDLIKARKPPPAERRKAAVEGTVERRAHRAKDCLERAIKQRAAAQKRVEKWSAKVAYYKKRGVLPEDA